MIWSLALVEDDSLVGSEGDDDLYGGLGGDQFWCDSGMDTIHDYSPVEGDKIMSESDCEIVNPVCLIGRTFRQEVYISPFFSSSSSCAFSSLVMVKLVNIFGVL